GVYLVPALDVIASSPRAGVSTWSAQSSLGWRWIELLAPNGLGVPGATGPLRGAMSSATNALPFIGSLYIGGSVLIALISFPRRRRTKLDYAVLAIVCALLFIAHGDALPGAGALWSALRARFPEKVL